MRSFLWIICIGILISSTLKAQEGFQPLSGHNFQEPGYTLLFFGLATELSKDKVLYTTRFELLEAFNQEYTVNEDAVTYPFGCNDGYRVVLQKDKKVLTGFDIRYRCQALVDSSNRYWHYIALGSAVLSNRLDTASMEQITFENLEEARKQLKGILELPEVVGIENPDWQFYDGYFYFRVPNPNKSGRAPFTEWEDVKKKVRSDIRKKYLDERFELELTSYGWGASYPVLLFRLKCKRSLYATFDLYEKSSSGWKDYTPSLTVYKH